MSENMEPEEFMAEQDWMEPEGERKARLLPEAPASANLKAYIDGFGIMITVRGTEATTLVAEIEKMVSIAKAKGWMPSWNTETNKAFQTAVTSEKAAADSKWCSVHGESMPKKFSEKKQKNYWSHTFNGKMCFGNGIKE